MVVTLTTPPCTATIHNLIKKHLPQELRVSNDTVDMLYKCCNEFVQAVYSEANEISAKDNKTTITPDHITQAMQELGFDDFLEEVKLAHEQWKAEQQRMWAGLCCHRAMWCILTVYLLQSMHKSTAGRRAPRQRGCLRRSRLPYSSKCLQLLQRKLGWTCHSRMCHLTGCIA